MYDASKNKLTIVGVGNVLQLDDGIGVYAISYLEQNYTFTPAIKCINGGVEGMGLLNLLSETEHMIILDAIEINDEAGSIYVIPASELSGYGLNGGGAHEIGILQCFDMLELQGKPTPQATVIGIVPYLVSFDIALSTELETHFDKYIHTILHHLSTLGYSASALKNQVTLSDIIQKVNFPS
ncbi:MAG: HyaD/HybD family hydrogenase maturation endopeptidase [Sulfurovaceae bacterium]|nr:HyaD/HybD family hydrogenase maturation endopeptidase [Sulfurovaceae bacterium]